MNNVIGGLLLAGQPLSMYFPEVMLYWGLTFCALLTVTMIYNAMPEPAPEMIRVEPIF